MAKLPWENAEPAILDGLQRLTTEGGVSNFMIVSAGEVYVQFAGSRGTRRVQCETIGNDFLNAKRKLAPERIDQLEKLHFDLQDEPPNFARDFEVETAGQASELARLTLTILEEIYGCARTSPLEIELTLE